MLTSYLMPHVLLIHICVVVSYVQEEDAPPTEKEVNVILRHVLLYLCIQ